MKKVGLLNIFVKICDAYFDEWKENAKEQHLFETFCNIKALFSLLINFNQKSACEDEHYLVVFKSQTASSYQFLILCGLMSVCNPLFVFLISVCEILWFRSVYTDSGSCNPDTRSCLVILQWQQNATAGVQQISEPDNTCLSQQIVGRTETVPVKPNRSERITAKMRKWFNLLSHDDLKIRSFFVCLFIVDLMVFNVTNELKPCC